MHLTTRKLSKHFHVSLFDQCVELGRSMLGVASSVPASRRIAAVDSVDLDIRDGERVGIVGHNGAGKTTLLQMLAGISVPTSGELDVEGKVSCLMTLGQGLREDLTGRENIFIDGEANGFGRAEIARHVQEIVDFSELGEFMDRPVRTYSSGMKARLAFSMITNIEPEILMIDEVLSAGDAVFCQKATAKMKELCAKGRILIVASHSMPTIIDMCTRCVWMDHGRMRMDGDPSKVTEAYLEYVREQDENALYLKSKKRIKTSSFVDHAGIGNVRLVGEKGESGMIFDVGERFGIRFDVFSSKPLDRWDAEVEIERMDGILLIKSLLSEFLGETPPLDGRKTLEFPVAMNLGKHSYGFCVRLLEGESRRLAAEHRGVFRIENTAYPHSNPVCWHKAEWVCSLVPPPVGGDAGQLGKT